MQEQIQAPNPEVQHRKRSIAAIIAIVMLATPVVGTLILYGFTYTHTKQNNILCETRMTMLGQAFQEYAKDHNETLPQATNWTEAIRPYLKNTDELRCPNDLTEGLSSYAMNEALSGKKLSDLKNTPKLVLLYEVQKAGNAPHGNGDDIYDVGHDKGGQGRHGMNFYRFNYYLFADGTVTFPVAFRNTIQYNWKIGGTNQNKPLPKDDHPGNSMTF